MYLRDGAVTAIVLTGGYYYCNYTFFFFTYTSILIPRGGEGWGGVLQIARQSGCHDDLGGKSGGSSIRWSGGPVTPRIGVAACPQKGSSQSSHVAARDALTHSAVHC